MYCTKCGNEVASGQRFCENCGNEVEMKTENLFEAADNTQESLDETVRLDGNAVDNYPQFYGNSDDTGYDDKSPKNNLKKRLLKVILPIVLILAIGLGAYAHPALRNSILRTIKSDRQYFAYVVENSVDKGLSDLSFDSGLLNNVSDGKNGAKADLELEIGQAVWDLADKMSGQKVSGFLNWLKTIGLTFDISANDNTYGIGADLLVNGKPLADADVVVKEGEVFVTSPSLNDTSIRISPETAGVNLNMGEFSETLKTFSKIIPDEAAIVNILKRYIGCVVNNITDVTENDVVLTAAAVNEKAIEFTINIDEQSAVNIAKACLNELKNDNDIKSIIKNICEAGITDKSFEDVYSEFTVSVSEAYDALMKVEPNPNSEKLPLKVFANKRGEIIGMELMPFGEGFKYYTTHDGEKYGLLLSLELTQTSVSYEGAGTVKGGKFNGDYSLNVMGMDAVNVKLENVDSDLMDEGIFNGTIRLTPGATAQGLIANAGMEKELVSLVSGMEIVLECANGNSDKGNANIIINSNSQKMLALKLGYGASEGFDCTIPTSYIDANDEDEMSKWLEKCGKNIIGRLKDVGVPSYLLYFMEQ